MRSCVLALSLLLGALSAAAPVLAAGDLPAGFRVRHQHALDGCDGFLIFTEQVVSYESSDTPAHSSQWRLAEIKALASPNRRTVELEAVTGEKDEYTLVRGDLSDELYQRILKRIEEVKSAE